MMMQKQFQILENRPTLRILVTRDSVCAGDDCTAPHEKNVSSRSFVDPVALVAHVATGYLPNVNGIGHTWDCVLNGKVIAIVSREGIEPKVNEVTYSEHNTIHFAYYSARY